MLALAAPEPGDRNKLMNDAPASRQARPPARRQGLTSGALCLQAGLSRGALRLYEREGLIAPPPRTEGGYRLYPLATRELLVMIRFVKELGFSLAEIKGLIDILNREGFTAEELRSIAVKRLQLIDAKMAGLTELRACIVECMENPDDPGDEQCAMVMRLLRARLPATETAVKRAERSWSAAP